MLATSRAPAVTATIDLSSADLAILRAVLRDRVPPDIRVWVFGSRATGGARRYSDLDLALEADGPIDPDTIAWLRSALSESDLTIKVDVIDLRGIDAGFRRLIQGGMVALPRE